MRINIKFRRNNHEKYWKTEDDKDFYNLQELLEKMFEDTDVNRLEMVIEKVGME